MKIAGPAPDAVLLHADAHLVHARAASHEVNVINERIIIRSEAGWWLVHDRLISETPHDYDLRFQLSPEAQDHVHQVELARGTRAFLSPKLLVVPLSSGAAELTIEQGWFAPRYGERHAAPRLRIGQQATTGWFSTLLMPFRGAMPDIDFACDGHRLRVRIGEDATEEKELPCGC
jgi:Heparinase II/III-like protein